MKTQAHPDLDPKHLLFFPMTDSKCAPNILHTLLIMQPALQLRSGQYSELWPQTTDIRDMCLS